MRSRSLTLATTRVTRCGCSSRSRSGRGRRRTGCMFGPHVTNLGDDDRRFTARHVAYYERRARGGCGTIVVEGASVHESDWPYERAPLAARSPSRAGRRSSPPAGRTARSSSPRSTTPAGRARRPTARRRCGRRRGCRRSPRARCRSGWRPRTSPPSSTGSPPPPQRAVAAGCDGVEINAGQHSLVRQFLSGLTNQRGDEWGADRLRFARDGDRRRARRPSAPTASSGCACRATSWRRGPASRPRWRRRSPPSSSTPASTTSSSSAARSSRSSRPGPTSTSRPASTSTSPRPSPRAVDVPVVAAGLGRRRRPGRVGARRLRRPAALRRPSR